MYSIKTTLRVTLASRSPYCTYKVEGDSTIYESAQAILNRYTLGMLDEGKLQGQWFPKILDLLRNIEVVELERTLSGEILDFGVVRFCLNEKPVMEYDPVSDDKERLSRLYDTAENLGFRWDEVDGFCQNVVKEAEIRTS